MASDKWTLIRLLDETRSMLQTCKECMLRGYEQGKRDLTFDDRGRISYNQVIAILATDYLKHKERARAKRRHQSAAHAGRTGDSLGGSPNGMAESAPPSPLMHPDTDAQPMHQSVYE